MGLLSTVPRKIAAGVVAVAAVGVPACELLDEDVSADRCATVEAELESLDAVADAAQANPSITDADRAFIAQAERVAQLAWVTCQQIDGTTTTTGQTTTTTEPPITTTSTTGPPPSSTTTTVPNPQNPGLPVAPASIPAPATWAINSPFFANGWTQGGTDVAAFRTNCSFSHAAYNDPIVAPGQPGASHLHTFFGNASVTAASTTMDAGSSTCDGGTANRTGYWTPGVIDTRTDELITNFDTIGGQQPGPSGYLALQVYYKRGYQGVEAGEITRWFPAGLRMIAGNPRRTEPTGDGNPIIQYACTTPGPTGAVFGPENIPNCQPGQNFQMIIRFPQCWDGRNLDSIDHQSHMAYSIPGQGCPSSHPVPLPEITEHVRIRVPSGNNRAGQPHDTRYWALTSDTYLGTGNPNGRAGYSGHADWWNGWDPAVGQAIIDGCYVPREFDCQFSIPGLGSPEQPPPPR